jgi:hypothetical protein
MSCVLRAAGTNFDVTAFLLSSEVKPLSLWHRGEKRSPKSNPNETSGVRFQISTAEFNRLATQASDALAFFRENRDWLARLVTFPGVESVVADFGAETQAPYWASFIFEVPLLVALGEAGVALELSTYPSGAGQAGDA